MMKKYATSLAALITCLPAMLGWAAQIGEPAPPLLVKEWLKGNPVQIQPGTNIYVVEVWASWSLGSRAIITNLNQIHQRFADKGVVVVALSDEPIEKLKEFLENQGTNIQYAVAADDNHQTARSYMIPVHQQGLPYAFVVGTNGNLLWHDHPTIALSNVLEQVVAGKFDVAGAVKSWADRHQMEQYLGLVLRKDPRAGGAGRTLLALRTNDVELLCDLAYQIAIHPGLPKRDVALAHQALDQAQQIAVTNRVRVGLTRAVLLFETGKKNEAMALAQETLASATTQADKDWAQASLRTMEMRLKNPPRSKREPLTATNSPSAQGATNLPKAAAANEHGLRPPASSEKAAKAGP